MTRMSFARAMTAAALVVGGLAAAGPAAAVSATTGSISTPGYLPLVQGHHHITRTSGTTGRVHVVQPRRSFQSWQGCDTAGYRYMETPNYDIPVLCR